MPSPLEAALRRVPDRPEWVDTRGMLLTGRAEVHFASPADLAQGGFVVCLASRALMSVVGEPPARLVADAAARLTGDVNVLCPASQAAGVKEALPDWRRQSAIIHALQADPVDDGSDPENVRVFTATNAPSLAHVPETLRAELTDALAGRPTIRFVHGEVPPVGAADCHRRRFRSRRRGSAARRSRSVTPFSRPKRSGTSRSTRWKGIGGSDWRGSSREQ